jgi:hypothetical protein
MNNSPSENLQIIQHNTARSREIMHSVLDTAGRKGAHFVLIQEPYVVGDDFSITISHPNYLCILPTNPDNIRPRVAIYAKRVSRYSYCHRSDLTQDSDLLILDVSESGSGSGSRSESNSEL